MIGFNPIRLGRLKVVAEDTGTALVEFAIVAPVLVMMLLGIFQFGINLNQYVMLTNATAAGARLFSVSRGVTPATPVTNTKTLIEASAPTLIPASITFTFSVNGSPCSGDGTCSTALAAAPGGSATAATTYPCGIQVLSFLPPGCTLTAQSTERIE